MMAEPKEARLDYEYESNGVLVCTDFNSILDFINDLNKDLKDRIIKELEALSSYGVTFLSVASPGYIGLYKRGSVEDTTMFVFNTVDDMILYITDHPIHKTNNKDIIELLKTL